ncbi:Proton-dependent oligopeptide transporter family [Corchorus olitorius]|uniref:Proton-dependent oligopeptide transporter family n=1 Tax=Corchorus olitorius TaxID=93759 RepID=A0A1R3I485_9ROSI|nr:Proton-dependent oligopeptide transporter family [Corchorus olitorius]
MVVLTLTAAIHKLHPPKCPSSNSGTCVEPVTGQLAFLYFAFGLLVIGAGGIRPCNLAFGADQFDPRTESGQKGINSFFNCNYFTFTLGVMVSITLIVYIQSSLGWAIGLGIHVALMLFSCILFFMGSRLYVKVKPEGSPLTSVAQVLLAAARKRHLKLPTNNDELKAYFNYMPQSSINSKLPYTDQFSIQQVEEVKCLVRVILIWASSTVFLTAILIQQNTYLVFQALQYDRRLGSGDDRFKTHRKTRWWNHIASKNKDRDFVSLIAMLVFGLVEGHRRHLALTRPTVGTAANGVAISSMSAFCLVPQLVLTGISKGLGCIALNEFYYKQFPENMRSIVGSFFFLGLARSSYLNGFLVSIVHRLTSTTDGVGDWLADDLNKGSRQSGEEQNKCSPTEAESRVNGRGADNYLGLARSHKGSSGPNTLEQLYGTIPGIGSNLVGVYSQNSNQAELGPVGKRQRGGMMEVDVISASGQEIEFYKAMKNQVVVSPFILGSNESGSFRQVRKFKKTAIVSNKYSFDTLAAKLNLGKGEMVCTGCLKFGNGELVAARRLEMKVWPMKLRTMGRILLALKVINPMLLPGHRSWLLQL